MSHVILPGQRGAGKTCRRIGLALIAAAIPLLANAANLPLPDSGAAAVAAPATADLARVQQAFSAQVRPQRKLSANTIQSYAGRLDQALADAGIADPGQWIVLVDRSPHAQTALLFARASNDAPWQWIGAAPVSTGKPGQFDHFVTPLGVFDHNLDNMDFRAEGTLNENGIRGYGVRGMRVYDFGWVEAQRGWGKGGESEMRLQMHATDPDRLEQRLGQSASKGCIRIPAALNRLIDHFGLLDADYLAAVERGESLWVLKADRSPVANPGRYVVVIDSSQPAPVRTE